MSKLKNKLTKVFILMMAILNVISYTIPVYALTVGNGTTDKIEVNINTDKTEFNDWDFFEFTFDYRIVGELGCIKEGEEISFYLPEEFKNADINYPRQHFKEMKREGDKVTLVFGEGVQKAVAGYIKAKGRVTSSSSTKEKRIVVEVNGSKIAESSDIKINGNEIVNPDPMQPANPEDNNNVNPGDNSNSQKGDRLLLKDIDDHIGFDNIGNILSEVTGRVVGKTKKYRVYINERYDSLQNLRLMDTMPEGMELITDSLKICKIDLSGISQDETESFLKNIDSTMLDISFNSIDSKYLVEYETKITEDKDKYVNTAKLYVDDQWLDSTVIVNKKVDEGNIVSKYAYNLKEMTDANGKTIKVASLYDKVPYSVCVNKDKLYLENAIFEDFIPKGMKYISDSLIIGEYDEKENFKWVTDDFKDKVKFEDDKITIDFGDTENKYVLEYKLEIVSPNKTYENKAKVSYGEKIKESIETVRYEMGAGAINAEKLVDKTIIKSGEDTNLVYTINVESFGFFEENYLTIQDSLDKRLKILKVDAPDDFSASIDTDTNTINIVNDKKEVSYGEKVKINIYVDSSGVEYGSTIKNVAKINTINTNEVKTKKGYAFTAKKVDAQDDNKALEGAKFLLKDNQGNIIKELISNENGVIKSEIVDPGSYYLEEIEAPEGYDILKNDINFEIKDEDIGKTLEIGNIKNDESKGKVIIKKVDANNLQTLLPGAEFSIFNNKGDKIDNIITNEGGIAEVSLIPGKYKLVEVKAPKDYILNQTPINFEIEFNQQKDVQLEVKNVKSEEISNENWEELQDLDIKDVEKDNATVNTEEDLSKPEINKPEVVVDESTIVEPGWEEIQNLDTKDVEKDNVTVNTAEDLNKPEINKPEVVVDESTIVEPGWEEIKDLDIKDVEKDNATVTIEEELNKPEVNKPQVEVDESIIIDPEGGEMQNLDIKDVEKDNTTVNTEEGLKKPEAEISQSDITSSQNQEISQREIIKSKEEKSVKQPKTGDSSLDAYLLILISSILGLILVSKKL